MKKYNPSTIEKKWQEYWVANKTFKATENPDKEKKFVLVEFPYPSGDGLHMGHLRSYTAADVLARFYRMQGKEVMYPLGWDAFGLPAENYAIKHGVQPAVTTAKNISNIKKQCQALGYSFDWDREVNTTDPNYYKWTQWLFLQFYKAGLAYEATGLINWCPKDKTGLANEEVINGECERCGTKVEKKELRQWYLKITEYAEKLLQGLENLPEWPEAVKLQQQNWIGKSEGAEIDFSVIPAKAGTQNSGSRGSDFISPEDDKSRSSGSASGSSEDDIVVKVFTTRPDTIFGATYLVVAPEHELISILSGRIENIEEVQSYIEVAKAKQEQERTAEDKEKTGVELKGIKALNPASGEEIPIWVADYVLGNYGTGAIMAVPAHDERDFAFAKKFTLPVKQAIAPYVVDTVNPPREGEQNTERNMVHVIVLHPTEEKVLTLKWRQYPWHTFISGGIEAGESVIETAQREVTEETGYLNTAVVGVMPYVVLAEFFAAHKNVNRKITANVVFLKLTNLERGDLDLEPHEQFDAEWIDLADMNKLSPVSELEYILDWFKNGDRPYLGIGRMLNSGEFTGQNSEAALPKMAQKYGTPKTTYKLRDWVFSRQRYWGEPIPIIHCDKDGIVPVPEDQLPVVLPEVDKYEPTGTGESPLAAIDEWVNTEYPKCGGPAKRETNTMPQWAGSSWYYLRYTDSHNSEKFASQENLKYWLPVDTYFGDMEHTTLHLLYSRFWNIFLYDQGLVPVSEPYKKRVPHGIVLASDGSKMSKSKGNVVNPDELVKKYGADTTRMYELFLGPHGASVAWNDQGISGVARFLDRVWLWIQSTKWSDQNSDIAEREFNILAKKITEDIENFSFNTAVSSFMKFFNEIREQEVSKQCATDFAKLLAPFAPHLAEEIYSYLGNQNGLHTVVWPKYDESKIQSEQVKIIVQVNGKVRDEFLIARDASEEDVVRQALAQEKVIAHLDGATPKKTIYVPGRLVNLVV